MNVQQMGTHLHTQEIKEHSALHGNHCVFFLHSHILSYSTKEACLHGVKDDEVVYQMQAMLF